MRTLEALWIICILLATLCLPGCWTFKLGGDRPIVDVDIGNGKGSSYETTDDSYKRYLDIVGLKVKRYYDDDDLNARISGRIKNRGKKTATYIKVTFLFMDKSGKLVDDKNKKIFDGNLKPGKTEEFEIKVHDIKKSWSGSVPEVQFEKVKVRRD